MRYFVLQYNGHILNCLFQIELSVNRLTFLRGGGGSPENSQIDVSHGTNRYARLPLTSNYNIVLVGGVGRTSRQRSQLNRIRFFLINLLDKTFRNSSESNTLKLQKLYKTMERLARFETVQVHCS